jgi:hypothetical protein
MKSKDNQNNTSSTIVDNNMLSFVIAEAFQGDKHLKELYKQLSEIHSKAFLVGIQISPTEFKVTYSDEVKELIGKVQQAIGFRQEEILSLLKNNIMSKEILPESERKLIVKYLENAFDPCLDKSFKALLVSEARVEELERELDNKKNEQQYSTPRFVVGEIVITMARKNKNKVYREERKGSRGVIVKIGLSQNRRCYWIYFSDHYSWVYEDDLRKVREID